MPQKGFDVMLDWLKRQLSGPPSRPLKELPKPSAEVAQLTNAGQVIDAIKLYRDQNPGVGLKEAKDVVDTMRRPTL